jgi:hypothetical protein
MKRLLFCCIALATAGCTISTELDPQGAPKYRRGVKATGTNFAGNRFDAVSAPATKALGQDDVDRLMRPGGSGPRPGQN